MFQKGYFDTHLHEKLKIWFELKILKNQIKLQKWCKVEFVHFYQKSYLLLYNDPTLSSDLFNPTIFIQNCIYMNFRINLDSKKFVVRFQFYWRPPEGFYFHWRGFKKCFLQFKTLCSVIYIPLEGFRYPSWWVIIPLEGFSYSS